MPALVLSEEEQVAMRAVIAGEPVPEIALHHEGPLRHLARLIASDAMGIALLDATGCAVGEMALHGRRTSGDAPPWDDGSVDGRDPTAKPWPRPERVSASWRGGGPVPRGAQGARSRRETVADPARDRLHTA